MPLPYNFDFYQRSEVNAAEQLDKVQWRTAEERTKFFERLALLSAGAVVLSVSLLSSVFGKTLIHGTAFLFGGWICLIVAMMASLFRELKYQAYTFETFFANYQSALAAKKTFLFKQAAAGEPVIDEPQEDGSVRYTTAEALKKQASEIHDYAKTRKNRAAQFQKTMLRFELISINAFWIGILLLGVFAAINVVLGAGQHYFK